jgi:hypothetical protein
MSKHKSRDYTLVCAGCAKSETQTRTDEKRPLPTCILFAGWFEDADPEYPGHPTKRLRYCPDCKEAPVAEAESRIAAKRAEHAKRKAERMRERAAKVEAAVAERRAQEAKYA